MRLSTTTSIMGLKEAFDQIGKLSYPHCKADDDELGKAFREINKLAENGYKIIKNHPHLKDLD